jgi:hypothetical protein
MVLVQKNHCGYLLLAAVFAVEPLLIMDISSGTHAVVQKPHLMAA